MDAANEWADLLRAPHQQERTMNIDIAGEDLNPILDAIDSAEEIPDTLDGLVEKSAEDPGAAFTPEVLERLVALKSEDRAAFEALRARLKKAGCRVTALDEAMAEESGDGGRGPTQADILIDLGGAADLFHSADGTALADILINEHRETWPVRTKGFRRWLARQFYEQTGGAPSSEALQSALNVIEAKAHFDGPERPVFIRVGGLDGRLYLGPRRHEMAGLAPDDIIKTPNGWAIHIRTNANRRIKNVQSDRLLPLPDEMERLGLLHIARRWTGQGRTARSCR